MTVLFIDWELIFQTIEDHGLDIETVEEEYTPEDTLRRKPRGIQNDFVLSIITQTN
jgi:hypothetical protein